MTGAVCGSVDTLAMNSYEDVIISTKSRLARHIFCVLLYHDEIKALTGTEEVPDQSITTRDCELIL